LNDRGDDLIVQGVLVVGHNVQDGEDDNQRAKHCAGQ
jgi:hypothetical protein